jgi:hypothetical protein
MFKLGEKVIMKYKDEITLGMGKFYTNILSAAKYNEVDARITE